MAKSSISSLNSPENDELVALLREVRKEKGVSQEDLSERLGESVNFILKIEKQGRRIDVVEFTRLAHALGVDASELYTQFLARIKAIERPSNQSP